MSPSLRTSAVISCAFDRKGESWTNFFDRPRFEKWLELLPPQIGFMARRTADEFLLTGSSHTLEYVSPLHINGEIRGAIVVGFARKQDLNDSAIKVDRCRDADGGDERQSLGPLRGRDQQTRSTRHARSIDGLPRPSSTPCPFRSTSSIAIIASSHGTVIARSAHREYRAI